MKTSAIILVSFFLFTSCKKQKEDTLNIAVASNMQFAIEELVTEFSKQTGIETVFITGSSGKLTAQIKQGAPYHVFLSADMKYPYSIYNDKLTVDKPQVYALGNLILWTNTPTVIPSLKLLKSLEPHQIAIANPRTAPYGKATIEVLIKHNLYKDLKEQLVYSESIAQVNQFISSKACKVGFTNKSIVFKNTSIKKNTWINIPKGDYTPIKQGIIVLNKSKKEIKRALLFRDYLISPKGQQILLKYGYSSYEGV